MSLSTPLLRKAHYHMLRAEFLCKCSPETGPKQCPDEAGETPEAFDLSRSICELWQCKQIIRLQNYLYRSLKLHGSFTEHTEKSALKKALITFYTICLFLKLGFKATVLATTLLLPHRCQLHWLGWCWREMKWLTKPPPILQHPAVVEGWNTHLHCSCCDMAVVQGSHACFRLDIPWKDSLCLKVKTAPPVFGMCLHKSQGIQILGWRISQSQMEAGWMDMCCNERDWKLAFRNADCLDFHSAKKNRNTLMVYVSQLTLTKYPKHTDFKTVPKLNQNHNQGCAQIPYLCTCTSSW